VQGSRGGGGKGTSEGRGRGGPETGLFCSSATDGPTKKNSRGGKIKEKICERIHWEALTKKKKIFKLQPKTKKKACL